MRFHARENNTQLTLYLTTRCFDDSEKNDCENNVEKGDNSGTCN